MLLRVGKHLQEIHRRDDAYGIRATRHEDTVQVALDHQARDLGDRRGFPDGVHDGTHHVTDRETVLLHVALPEVFEGRGLILVCPVEVAGRLTADPIGRLGGNARDVGDRNDANERPSSSTTGAPEISRSIKNFATSWVVM